MGFSHVYPGCERLDAFIVDGQVNVSVVFSPFFWGESDAFCSKGEVFALLCLGVVKGFRSDSENDMEDVDVDGWLISIPAA
jgi:hypothetical protein